MGGNGSGVPALSSPGLEAIMNLFGMGAPAPVPLPAAPALTPGNLPAQPKTPQQRLGMQMNPVDVAAPRPFSPLANPSGIIQGRK